MLIVLQDKFPVSPLMTYFLLELCTSRNAKMHRFHILMKRHQRFSKALQIQVFSVNLGNSTSASVEVGWSFAGSYLMAVLHFPVPACHTYDAESL